jgi:hypothetical protein
MQLSGATRTAVRLAAEGASAAGADRVDGAHLLAGLAAADGGARHALGAIAERLRTPAGAVASRPSSFADDARAALEAAARHAVAAGRGHVVSADVLDAVLADEDGAAARTLRAAGHEPSAVRAGLAGRGHQDCCPETVPTHAAATLAELGAHAAVLPRWAWLAGLATRVGALALLYALVLAIARDTAGPEIIIVVAAGSMLVALAMAPIRQYTTLRRLTRPAAHTVALPPEAAPLLDRLGLGRLEVRVGPASGADRCHRRGRRAWILIGPNTDHDPERARFVLWHEAAHLARRDSRVRIITSLLGLGLWTGALLSFDLRALLAAAIGVPVVLTAGRWCDELACDRIAVRAAGPGPLRAWAAEHRALVSTLRASGRPPRRRRFRGRLSHPPLRLRVALHARRPRR